MSKTYRHIFFDLDRTLWHFEENSKKVLYAIFDEYELSKQIETADDFLNQYYQINDLLWERYRHNKITKEELRDGRFKMTLEHFNIDNNKLAADISNFYLTESPKQTTLLPYAAEVLSYLYDKYQLHIITNGFEEAQHVKLNTSNISQYFNQLIFSEKVGVKKPHPLIFKRALKFSGAKAQESVMIGDDYNADIYGAQRVNMDSIYFNFYQTPHQYAIDKEINCLSELKGLL